MFPSLFAMAITVPKQTSGRITRKQGKNTIFENE